MASRTSARPPASTGTTSPAAPAPKPPITTPSANPPLGGWIAGTVVAAPGCPGPVIQGHECPPRPVAGAEVDVTGNNRAAIVTSADATGAFKVSLAPGTYTVTAFNVGPIRSTATQTVTVGTTGTTITLTVDSGIR